jgi:hypothetical protein
MDVRVSVHLFGDGDSFAGVDGSGLVWPSRGG